MCCEARTGPVTMDGRMARATVCFDGPVRNVEAMIPGLDGPVDVVRVDGERVEIAARLTGSQTCENADAVVMAEAIGAVTPCAR